MVNIARWFRTPPDELGVFLFAAWVIGMLMMLAPVSALPEPYYTWVGATLVAMTVIGFLIGCLKFMISLAWPSKETLEDPYHSIMTKYRVKR